MSAPESPAAAPYDLRARLAGLTLSDEQRLGRRLAGLRKIKDGGKRAKAKDELIRQVDDAQQRVQLRQASVPEITYPDLPVAARADELAEVIAANQVVIVAGETGSGKSTQLPKICLQLGRGVRGMIGHTQPRRIAARALAERIAEETGTELGQQIGYTIRFGDHTAPTTLIKLMTDGILLAEIGRDRMLSRYDTIIIDEAHERSLNIDFLLGYLTELLPRRPDLKVIITSATIDPERFSRHFGNAPIVEVSGRTYPVEIRYRPWGSDVDDDDDDPADGPGGQASTGKHDRSEVDQASAICSAVDELSTAGDGDVLVFLSGEREITDTADVLRAHFTGNPRYTTRSTEVVPLYGRLSAAEQHRVFSAHSGRRIVLATNVAETSLTVPGIRYVIDPGTARISRYSTRTKVQRLPIEKISQASAGQRAGRCGRVADGICIRLYAEDDFAARPEFTEPEISRTSLASVILQMASLGLGDIASFPFVEPPDTRQITDGVRVLDELGALDRSAGTSGPVRLTPVGRQLAALPVDPQFARMIVEGDRRGCLAEVLVITAALAIQDVREYPLEDRDKATAVHARFADPTSDFAAIVNLWHYLQNSAKNLSGNAFRRMCRTEYLHYLRIREWQDLHAQLRQVARQLGFDTSASATDDAIEVRGGTDAKGEKSMGRKGGGRRRGKGSSAFAAAKAAAQESTDQPVAVKPATQQGKGALAVGLNTEAVHTALLAGLLSHIGTKLEPGREYQGTRGTRFMIWPGSLLARTGPKFVVAAELVETSRLWGRMVASVDPRWVEKVGEHLVQRSYSEPRWDAKRGAVVATERVTLLSVVLTAARTVQFDRIEPRLARELFIRHALVEGDWETRHPWFAANANTMREVAKREDRARRRDILIDDEALQSLYEARIPADVTSGRHVDAWWRTESKERPDLLTFTPEMLIAAGAQDVSAENFPDSFTSGGVDLPLDYVYDPTAADDGVSATIPLAVLSRVDPAEFQAQIPGLRSELAVALLRSLPKSLRRNFVPAPDFATAALARIDLADAKQRDRSAFPARFAAELAAMTGISVNPGDFDTERMPEHLRMTFRITDARGTIIATGKDLRRLQEDLRSSSRDAVAAAVQPTGADLEQRGLTSFPPAGIDPEIVRTVDGHQVRAFPALIDEGKTVGIRVFALPADQTRAMQAGTRRLLALTARKPIGFVRHQLDQQQLLTLATAPHGSLDAVVDDALDAAVDALLDWAGGPAWDAAGFALLQRKLAPHLDKAVFDVVAAGERALRAAHQAQLAVAQVQGGALAAAAIDMRGQLSAALPDRFLAVTGAGHLPDLERHLQALAIRAERARQNPDRDRERMAEVMELVTALDDRIAGMRPTRRTDADVSAVRRMIDEFRVAQFAQPMRTAIPVSAKRIHSAIAALTD